MGCHICKDEQWLSHQLNGMLCDATGLSESYNATAGEFAGQACPPCLLIDRPACTLDHWLSNARAEATVPAWSDKASSLHTSCAHSTAALPVPLCSPCDMHSWTYCDIRLVLQANFDLHGSYFSKNYPFFLQ